MGVFLPRKALFFPLLFPSSSPFARNHSQPLHVSQSFLSIFQASSAPTPLEDPEIKDFRGLPLFFFRGWEEAGSVFGEDFQGDFSGFSGDFRRGFPSCFYRKNLGRGGWKGGRGCGRIGGGGGKIKICI